VASSKNATVKGESS